eukprot:3880056-Amphidinium_carterae.1
MHVFAREAITALVMQVLKTRDADGIYQKATEVNTPDAGDEDFDDTPRRNLPSGYFWDCMQG